MSPQAGIYIWTSMEPAPIGVSLQPWIQLEWAKLSRSICPCPNLAESLASLPESSISDKPLKVPGLWSNTVCEEVLHPRPIISEHVMIT